MKKFTLVKILQNFYIGENPVKITGLRPKCSSTEKKGASQG